MFRSNLLWKRWGLPFVFLLLLVTSACNPSFPSPSPVPTSTIAPVPSPALPIILDAMKPVLRGQGVPDAAVYDPNSRTPHRFVILEPSGEPHRWNDHLFFPIEWQPSSINDTELVVIVYPERERVLDTQEYIGGPPITRYRFERDVEIRKAQTGEVLWRHTIQGSQPPPFPIRERVEVTRLEGGHVGADEVFEYLRERLCTFPDQCPSMVDLSYRYPAWGLGSIIISPNGQLLAFIADDKLYLFRTADGNLLHVFASGWPIAFSPDSQVLALRDGSQVQLWQVANMQLLYAVHGYWLTFSPDGQVLALETDDNTVWILQAADGRSLHALTPEEEVTDITFSPDSEVLAARSDNRVWLWRVEDGKVLVRWKPPKGYHIEDLSISPDSLVLAATIWNYFDKNAEVHLWRVADGKMFRTLDLGPGGSMAYIEFSPDGQLLALASMADEMIQVWRVADGQLLYSQDGRHIAFSPDGQVLAVAMEDGSVQLLRAADGYLLRTLFNDDFVWVVLDDGPVLVRARLYWTSLWAKATKR